MKKGIEMEERSTLASELLHELKLSARRWFIIAVIELVILVSLVGGFIWYISLPVEDYSLEQVTEQGGDNFNVGGDYNGTTED